MINKYFNIYVLKNYFQVAGKIIEFNNFGKISLLKNIN